MSSGTFREIPVTFANPGTTLCPDLEGERNCVSECEVEGFGRQTNLGL